MNYRAISFDSSYRVLRHSNLRIIYYCTDIVYRGAKLARVADLISYIQHFVQNWDVY